MSQDAINGWILIFLLFLVAGLWGWFSGKPKNSVARTDGSMLKVARNIDKVAKIIAPLEFNSYEEVRAANKEIRDILTANLSNSTIASSSPELLATFIYGMKVFLEKNLLLQSIYVSSFKKLKNQCEFNDSNSSAEVINLINMLENKMDSVGLKSHEQRACDNHQN